MKKVSVYAKSEHNPSDIHYCFISGRILPMHLILK